MKIRMKLLKNSEIMVARYKLAWMIYWSGIRAEIIGLRLKTPVRLRKKTAITRPELLKIASKNCLRNGAEIIQSAARLKKFWRK